LQDSTNRILPLLGKWKGHSQTKRSGVYGATIAEADTISLLEMDDKGQLIQVKRHTKFLSFHLLFFYLVFLFFSFQILVVYENKENLSVISWKRKKICLQCGLGYSSIAPVSNLSFLGGFLFLQWKIPLESRTN
jgi:hypothetical protein